MKKLFRKQTNVSTTNFQPKVNIIKYLLVDPNLPKKQHLRQVRGGAMSKHTFISLTNTKLSKHVMDVIEMDLSVTCLQVDSLFSHIIPRKTDGEKKQTGWWFQRI